MSVSTSVFDVTDADSVRAAVDQIEAEGPIDILINNAGMQIRGPLHEYADSDWHTIMKTNLDSVYFVGQAVAKKMIPRGRGKIINICSVQSELGRPGIAPYTATKGAVKELAGNLTRQDSLPSVSVISSLAWVMTENRLPSLPTPAEMGVLRATCQTKAPESALSTVSNPF